MRIRPMLLRSSSAAVVAGVVGLLAVPGSATALTQHQQARSVGRVHAKNPPSAPPTVVTSPSGDVYTVTPYGKGKALAHANRPVSKDSIDLTKAVFIPDNTHDVLTVKATFGAIETPQAATKGRYQSFVVGEPAEVRGGYEFGFTPSKKMKTKNGHYITTGRACRTSTKSRKVAPRWDGWNDSTGGHLVLRLPYSCFFGTRDTVSDPRPWKFTVTDLVRNPGYNDDGEWLDGVPVAHVHLSE